jgi:flavin reductase (DIM6/NTAB) family NADH-FMN oxidoreductase RutF
MDLKALHKLGYGLYIVSSRSGNKVNGQIANTGFQMTSEPPTIAVSINKANLTHKFIEDSRVFLCFYPLSGYTSLFRRSLWLQVRPRYR